MSASLLHWKNIAPKSSMKSEQSPKIYKRAQYSVLNTAERATTRNSNEKQRKSQCACKRRLGIIFSRRPHRSRWTSESLNLRRFFREESNYIKRKLKDKINLQTSVYTPAHWLLCSVCATMFPLAFVRSHLMCSTCASTLSQRSALDGQTDSRPVWHLLADSSGIKRIIWCITVCAYFIWETLRCLANFGRPTLFLSFSLSFRRMHSNAFHWFNWPNELNLIAGICMQTNCRARTQTPIGERPSVMNTFQLDKHHRASFIEPRKSAKIWLFIISQVIVGRGEQRKRLLFI